jgi:purple acid phosphatase-like protein
MKTLLVMLAAGSLMVGTAIAQYQNPNPNPRERSQENAQERASHINDAVDIVSGPTVENLSPTHAELVWQTNKEAATRVRYGTEPVEPSQHAYEPGGSRDHHVSLNNLRPNTTYHYEIETRGGKDRIKGSFRTPRG